MKNDDSHFDLQSIFWFLPMLYYAILWCSSVACSVTAEKIGYPDVNALLCSFILSIFLSDQYMSYYNFHTVSDRQPHVGIPYYAICPCPNNIKLYKVVIMANVINGGSNKDLQI